MANGKCHLHGGKSFGPPPGSRNGLKHGGYTPEGRAARRQAKAAQRAIAAEVAASVAAAEKLASPPRPRGRPRKKPADGSPVT